MCTGVSTSHCFSKAEKHTKNLHTVKWNMCLHAFKYPNLSSPSEQPQCTGQSHLQHPSQYFAMPPLVQRSSASSLQWTSVLLLHLPVSDWIKHKQELETGNVAQSLHMHGIHIIRVHVGSRPLTIDCLLAILSTLVALCFIYYLKKLCEWHDPRYHSVTVFVITTNSSKLAG